MRRFREWISNDLIYISKKIQNRMHLDFEDDGSSVIIIGGIIGIIFCLFFS